LERYPYFERAYVEQLSPVLKNDFNFAYGGAEQKFFAGKVRFIDVEFMQNKVHRFGIRNGRSPYLK